MQRSRALTVAGASGAVTLSASLAFAAATGLFASPRPAAPAGGPQRAVSSAPAQQDPVVVTTYVDEPSGTDTAVAGPQPPAPATEGTASDPTAAPAVASPAPGLAAEPDATAS